MSEKILESIIFGLKATITEKDTEIKRLTFINEELETRNRILKKYKSMWAELDTTNAKQKAEIERLTEWKDKLQDTKDELEQQLIDTGFKEYCEENKRLTDENAELQKQVDELKTRVEYEKEYGNIKVAQALADFKIWKQQAVKDTAKEILQELSDFVDFETFREGYELIKVKRKIKER